MITSILASDGYIIVNKYLLTELGFETALMVGELCSEYEYWRKTDRLYEGRGFYSTQENIQSNTGLTPYQQRKGLEKLKELGVIEVKRVGIPSKNYYFLDETQLLKILTTTNESVSQLETNEFNLNNNKNNNKEEHTISKDIVEVDTSIQNTPTEESVSKPKRNPYEVRLDDIEIFLGKCKYKMSDKEKDSLRDCLKQYLDCYKNNTGRLPKSYLSLMMKLNERCFSYKHIIETINYSISENYQGFFAPPTNKKTHPDEQRSVGGMYQKQDYSEDAFV